MASFAKKTCYNCGIKLKYSEMGEKVINIKSGHSTGYGTNILSWFDEKRKNNINISRRYYTRKKTVWLCPECISETEFNINTSRFAEVLVFTILAIYLITLVPRLLAGEFFNPF